MADELRPTPILKGKVAKRFYREINNRKISKEQVEFLHSCVELLETTQKE